MFQIETLSFYKTCFDYLDSHQTPFATAENLIEFGMILYDTFFQRIIVILHFISWIKQEFVNDFLQIRMCVKKCVKVYPVKH